MNDTILADVGGRPITYKQPPEVLAAMLTVRAVLLDFCRHLTLGCCLVEVCCCVGVLRIHQVAPHTVASV
jgi:hypothetical protein